MKGSTTDLTSRARFELAVLSRAEPSRAEPSRAEPSRAEPSRAEAMTAPREHNHQPSPPDRRPPPRGGHPSSQTASAAGRPAGFRAPRRRAAWAPPLRPGARPARHGPGADDRHHRRGPRVVHRGARPGDLHADPHGGSRRGAGRLGRADAGQGPDRERASRPDRDVPGGRSHRDAEHLPLFFRGQHGDRGDRPDGHGAGRVGLRAGLVEYGKHPDQGGRPSRHGVVRAGRLHLRRGRRRRHRRRHPAHRDRRAGAPC